MCLPCSHCNSLSRCLYTIQNTLHQVTMCHNSLYHGAPTVERTMQLQLFDSCNKFSLHFYFYEAVVPLIEGGVQCFSSHPKENTAHSLQSMLVYSLLILLQVCHFFPCSQCFGSFCTGSTEQTTFNIFQ